MRMRQLDNDVAPARQQGGYNRGAHAGLVSEMRWRINSPISPGKAQVWRDSPMCAPR